MRARSKHQQTLRPGTLGAPAEEERRNQKEIMSPGEEGGTREEEEEGGRKADGALRMECVS